MDNLIEEYSWVIYAALKYFKNYANREDLIQVGFIGLFNAYKNYDEKQNTKFSSYAYLYVMGEMKKLIREDKPLKTSRKYSILSLKIEKSYMLLSQKLMREPTFEEIAEELQVPEYLIRDTLNCNSTKNLEDPVGDNLTLMDVMSDNNYDLDSYIILKESLETLNEEEQKIIHNRYINDYTQTETSKVMGMSQVQVSRKETKILQKLRKKMVA